MQILFPLLVGSYAILDALTLGLGEYERLGYAFLSCMLVAIFLVSKKYGRSSKSMTCICWSYTALVVIGFLMVAWQPQINWFYVLGDSVSIAMPLLMILLAERRKEPLYNSKLLSCLYLVLLIASIVPVVLPAHWFHTDRFEHPPLILAVLTCVGLLRPKNITQLFCNLFIFGLVIFLTLMSGARSALVIYLGAGITLFLLGQVSRQIACLGIAVVGGLLLALNLNVFDSVLAEDWSELRVGRFLDRYRDEGLLEGLLSDQSMNNRILEAEDVLEDRWNEGNFLQLILGSGHGATFQGVTAEYGDRALADGQVHHIHFGMVLLYYRYGLPGIAAFLWITQAAFRRLLTLNRRNLSYEDFYTSLVFSLGTLGYMAELLLFNQLVDPMLSLTIAGFITSRDRLGVRANSVIKRQAFSTKTKSSGGFVLPAVLSS